MALETGTYIDDLVATNPVSSDAKSQGDDHIRLVKTTLLNTFSGFTGPILVGGATGGSVNAYTLTPATAMPAWIEGTIVVCEFHLANTTTTPTLNISGLGAKTIVSCSGAALAPGDLLLNRYTAMLYDGTNLQLVAATKNYIDQLAFSAALPLQTGNAGKFVKTDGASASWELALPAQAGNSGKILTTNGTTESWADNLSDNSLARVMFEDCGYTVVDKGNISNATVTFDYTAGSVQTYTATGSTVTWAFSNWPPTGNLGELLIIGTNMGAYTHTISGLTWTLRDGTTTTSVVTFLAQNTPRTAFQSSGIDKILLVTRDSGTTVYASLVSI